MSDYTITPVSREDCKPFILDIHYAKRWPSVSIKYKQEPYPKGAAA